MLGSFFPLYFGTVQRNDFMTTNYCIGLSVFCSPADPSGDHPLDPTEGDSMRNFYVVIKIGSFLYNGYTTLSL